MRPSIVSGIEVVVLNVLVRCWSYLMSRDLKELRRDYQAVSYLKTTLERIQLYCSKRG